MPSPELVAQIQAWIMRSPRAAKRPARDKPAPLPENVKVNRILTSPGRAIVARAAAEEKAMNRLRGMLRHKDLSGQDWKSLGLTLADAKKAKAAHPNYKDAAASLGTRVRTHTVYGFNEARLAAIPVGWSKRWVARLDTHTRPAHRALMGQTVPKNKPFRIEGHSLMLPGDPKGLPELVMNCRCVLIAVPPAGIRLSAALLTDESAQPYAAAMDNDAPYGSDLMTAMVAAAGFAPVSSLLFVPPRMVEYAYAAGARVFWAGIIGVEGTTTGDGRLIDKGALSWTCPVPIRFVLQDNGAHDGAVVVGQITEVLRLNTGAIYGKGYIDTEEPAGAEAARLVTKRLMNGISMDLDNVTFELRVSKEPKPNENTVRPDDEITATTEARLRAATIVAIPAFAEAQIYVVEGPAADVETQTLTDDSDEIEDVTSVPATA